MRKITKKIQKTKKNTNNPKKMHRHTNQQN